LFLVGVEVDLAVDLAVDLYMQLKGFPLLVADLSILAVVGSWLLGVITLTCLYLRELLSSLST